MRHYKFVLFLLFALCVLVSAGNCLAQSTDQSNPTPISSNELIIKGPRKNNQQYYYSITGGPGEVSISLSVKAKAYSTFVGIKIFDAEMNTLTYHNMSADTGSPGMALKKFDVGEKQTLVMSFTSDSSLAECRLKFGGAVEFGTVETNSGLNSTTTVSEVSPTMSNSQPETVTSTGDQTSASSSNGAISKNKSFTFSIIDAVGQRFNIPATGKLHIEMKDGSVQEIDLTQVKKLLVKQ
jgi:hypothetical protein